MVKPRAYNALVHLSEQHAYAYWPYVQLMAYRERYLEWPRRQRLYQALRHYGFEGPAQVDAALFALDHLAQNGCGHLDVPCGTPVYKFEVRNARGPATIRYGLRPFPDALWENDRHVPHTDDWRGIKVIRSSLIFGMGDFYPATKRPAPAELVQFAPETNIGAVATCTVERCRQETTAREREEEEGEDDG
jgi:hypothetical protein